MATSRNQKTIPPFAGWPKTRERRDGDGNLAGYRISALHLTPFRAKFADQLGTASAVALVLGSSFWALSQRPDNPEYLILTVGGSALLHKPLQKLWRLLSRKKTAVEIDNDLIRVRRFFWWRSYDRRHEHRFALLPHDEMRREREEHDIENRKAQLKGKVAVPVKYYGESFHVVLVLLRQRIDIAAVFDQKKARALQARLEGCAGVIDAQRRTGEGLSSGPENDWSDAPGTIPG